jgi:hypothetical protein
VSGYTSEEFQSARRALLACSDADRAFLRRLLLRWTDEHGHVRRDADPLPAQGVVGQPGKGPAAT